jgi:hypothetical protein
VEVAYSKYDATAKEIVGAGKAVYVSGISEVKLACANLATTAVVVGFTEFGVAADNDVTVYTNDILGGFSGLVANNAYYLSQTVAGAITNVKPTSGIIMRVGVAVSSAELDIHIVELSDFNQSNIDNVAVDYNGNILVDSDFNVILL